MADSNFRVCPQCSEKNNPKFIECWKCRFDFRSGVVKVVMPGADPLSGRHRTTQYSRGYKIQAVFWTLFLGFAITGAAAHSLYEKAILIQKGVETVGKVTSAFKYKLSGRAGGIFYNLAIQVTDPKGNAEFFENTVTSQNFQQFGIEKPGAEIPIIYLPGGKMNRVLQKRSDLKGTLFVNLIGVVIVPPIVVFILFSCWQFFSGKWR